jgi:hypothetical protein
MDKTNPAISTRDHNTEFIIVSGSSFSVTACGRASFGVTTSDEIN